MQRLGALGVAVDGEHEVGCTVAREVGRQGSTHAHIIAIESGDDAVGVLLDDTVDHHLTDDVHGVGVARLVHIPVGAVDQLGE